MKAIILALTSLFVVEAQAVFLNHCSNFLFQDQAVSYSYESCVNRNFQTVERELENKVYMQYCSNFGDEVQYSYTSCINRNFRNIERELNVFLSFCSNFSRDELDYSFQSCVNRNFREISRELNDINN